MTAARSEHVSPSASADPLLRITQLLAHSAAVVAGAVLVIMALQIAVDVIGRYLFNTPLAGTIDLVSNWWMPIIALLAFANTETTGQHINVTIMSDRLRGIPRRVLNVLAALSTAAISLWLAGLCADDAVVSTQRGETAAGTGWLQIWPIKWVLVIGFVLLALSAIARAYHATRFPEERSSDD